MATAYFDVGTKCRLSSLKWNSVSLWSPGNKKLNQSCSRELFKFVFSILLKNFSFEKNEDIEK